jgi:hypothetical protein
MKWGKFPHFFFTDKRSSLNCKSAVLCHAKYGKHGVFSDGFVQICSRRTRRVRYSHPSSPRLKAPRETAHRGVRRAPSQHFPIAGAAGIVGGHEGTGQREESDWRCPASVAAVASGANRPEHFRSVQKWNPWKRIRFAITGRSHPGTAKMITKHSVFGQQTTPTAALRNRPAT